MTGTFGDGSGNKNYTDKSICQWLIQPPMAQHINLSFTSFDVNGPGDFVEVYAYDTLTAGGTLLGHFTGNTIPSNLTSTTGAMFLVFYTNSTGTAPGWQANYTTLQVGIEENSPVKEFDLYPNPAHNEVVVTVSSGRSGASRIEILDTRGANLINTSVETNNNPGKVVLNTSSLTPGIYMVRLSNGDTRITRKLVIF